MKYLLTSLICFISLCTNAQTEEIRLKHLNKYTFNTNGGYWTHLDSTHYNYQPNTSRVLVANTYNNLNYPTNNEEQYALRHRTVYTYLFDEIIESRQSIYPSPDWIEAERLITFLIDKKPDYREHYTNNNGTLIPLWDDRYYYTNDTLTQRTTYANFENGAFKDSGANFYYYKDGLLSLQDEYTWHTEFNNWVGNRRFEYVYKAGRLDSLKISTNASTDTNTVWQAGLYSHFEYSADSLTTWEYFHDYQDEEYVLHEYVYERYIDIPFDESGMEIIMYPNPAIDSIKFNQLEVSKITIYDSYAQLVHEQGSSASYKHVAVNINHLASGIYYIIFELNDTRKTFKLIKL